ncbi:MAG: FAD-dependent oxidoreductase, partial [Chloroflexota bacterium]
MSDAPKTAKVVIIGGGIMGCSLLYHLAHEGWTDSVLIEKAELTSGSTWHAAGQITHSVSSYAISKMVGYGIEKYKSLEEETGQYVSWHGCGSFRLAYTKDEMDWLRMNLSLGRAIGHPMELVDTKFIREKHPFYNLDGVLGALHTPEDGHVDPAGASFAFAKGAQQLGAQVIRRNRVLNTTKQPNGEWLVETEQGNWLCEYVVNAAGCFARQVGQWVGLDLPLTNMTHHYFVTEPVKEFIELKESGYELPVIRDDRLVSGYIRMEQDAGLIGIYEKRNSNSVWDDFAPWELENPLFDADYDRVDEWLMNSFDRMPILADKGIQRVVHGAISHPPDGNPMLGPAPGPDLENYWLCCGTQIGIGWGPGAGMYLAQWMVHGAADISMRAFDPRRFGRWTDETWRLEKAHEDYLLRHETPFPGLDRPNCRPFKATKLYDVLKEKGAVYQEVYGWDRPFWYAPEGTPREHIHSFRRTKLFDILRDECLGLRQNAGIADMSAFGKLEISGPDAHAFMSRVCANRIRKKVGAMALSQLLLPNGRVEGEATITTIAENTFYFVTAAVREHAMLDWLIANIQDGEDVTITNVSDDYGVLALSGPKSRDILSQCTDADLGNENFRWLTAQTIDVAGVTLRALRVAYTGELGWELHIPMQDMLTVYEALVAAGEPLGMVHVGSAAFNSLRMEKAYRSGSELTNEVTMAEVGLLNLARFDKEYVGVETNRHEKEHGVHKWVLAYIKMDDAATAACGADPVGGESIWFNGVPVGSMTSGGYGYSVGAPLWFAFVKPDAGKPGNKVGVMVQGHMIPGEILGEPAFDPQSTR